ncbi:hypothetical protein C8J56DRAFT_336180 [Mycena floridula]|nr:hypothetical protein C8J56DRAFT_336180 [Mycena floridula]
MPEPASCVLPPIRLTPIPVSKPLLNKDEMLARSRASKVPSVPMSQSRTLPIPRRALSDGDPRSRAGSPIHPRSISPVSVALSASPEYQFPSDFSEPIKALVDSTVRGCSAILFDELDKVKEEVARLKLEKEKLLMQCFQTAHERDSAILQLRLFANDPRGLKRKFQESQGPILSGPGVAGHAVASSTRLGDELKGLNLDRSRSTPAVERPAPSEMQAAQTGRPTSADGSKRTRLTPEPEPSLARARSQPFSRMRNSSATPSPPPPPISASRPNFSSSSDTRSLLPPPRSAGSPGGLPKLEMTHIHAMYTQSKDRMFCNFCLRKAGLKSAAQHPSVKSFTAAGLTLDDLVRHGAFDHPLSFAELTGFSGRQVGELQKKLNALQASS